MPAANQQGNNKNVLNRDTKFKVQVVEMESQLFQIKVFYTLLMLVHSARFLSNELGTYEQPAGVSGREIV